MVNIMTLKDAHGAFSGMCREFHGWRCEIARAAGYGTEEKWDLARIVLDWDTITDGNVIGVWLTPPADASLVLLAHRSADNTFARRSVIDAQCQRKSGS